MIWTDLVVYWPFLVVISPFWSYMGSNCRIFRQLQNHIYKICLVHAFVCVCARAVDSSLHGILVADIQNSYL
jgi:hypothetical protein